MHAKLVNNKPIYEIMVPTRIKNKGVLLSHHRAWDEKVRKIAGGLTVYKGAVGQWICPAGHLYRERVIPVRVICTEEEINLIADLTAEHYKQKAVMFYLVSDKAYIKHYDEHSPA